MGLLPARSCPGPRGSQSESRLAVKTEVTIGQSKIGAASEAGVASPGQCWAEQRVLGPGNLCYQFKCFSVFPD